MCAFSCWAKCTVMLELTDFKTNSNTNPVTVKKKRVKINNSLPCEGILIKN